MPMPHCRVRARCLFIILGFLALSDAYLSASLWGRCPAVDSARRSATLPSMPMTSQQKDRHGESSSCSTTGPTTRHQQSRRRVLKSTVSILSSSLVLPLLLSSSPATATATVATKASARSALDPDRTVDVTCLADLPPIPIGLIRIYLCRHGQTENNRLRKVQGARVDPPINDNGRLQAINLGRALALAGSATVETTTATAVPPQLVFSSSLQRAQMTAQLVAQELLKNTKDNHHRHYSIQQLPALGEIDFGPLADGQPIVQAQQKMTLAYTRWAMGQVDYRPDGGGESGREVLTRACLGLEQLVKEARAAKVSSVVAVSHSAFLRVDWYTFGRVPSPSSDS